MSRDSYQLDALETKLAFQEDALQELSDALVAQQARMYRLEARIELLTEQLAHQAESGGGSSEQPPPHY